MRRVLLPWLVSLALVGHIALRPIWDSDAGWHLAVGRLVRDRGLPRTNALSWTAPDWAWYPTSWLYDLAGALLEARLGPLGIQLVALALLAAALFLWGIALGDAAWLLPAGALALAPRVTHRPHLATWAALAAVLALGMRGRGRSTRYRLFALPVLVLAGNLHAGAAFAAGVIGLFCLEEFLRTRRAAELGVLALAGLSLVANPGGPYDLWYLFAHLRVQDVVWLVEFRPASPLREAAFFAALPLGLAAGVWRRRQVGWAPVAALAVLGALGLRTGRVSYDALFPALPLVGGGLLALREKWGPRAMGLSCALLALLAAVAVGYESWLATARIAGSWNAQRRPVRAALFLREAGLRERGFMSLVDGGYLEAQGIPGFADGRIQAYPESFWHAFAEAERSDALFRAWLESLGVEWALTMRTPERLAGYRLLNAPGWALVYWDEVSEVWVRREVIRLRTIIERFEYRHFKPYGNVLGAVVAVPRAELAAFAAEVERYLGTSPGDSSAALVLCAVGLRAGSPGAPRVCDSLESISDANLRALLPQVKALKPAP